ncbi:MAG: hypothetical protein PW788_11235 [Micavibrio sp.]|nr:hypothetical protein [Micavibrio sp.]
MPPKGFRTYVEFNLASKRYPRGEVRVAAVDSRDLDKLDLPKRAAQFFFYDTPDTITDLYETQNDQQNASTFYLVAQRMLTRDEAVLLDPKEKHLEGASDTLEHGRRLTDYQIAEAVWESKYDEDGVFALMRSGRVARVYDNNTVIDAKKRQLYPAPQAPVPVTPAPEAFTGALKRAISPLKPPRFRPKNF